MIYCKQKYIKLTFLSFNLLHYPIQTPLHMCRPLFKTTLYVFTCHSFQQLCRFYYYIFHILKLYSPFNTFSVSEVIKVARGSIWRIWRKREHFTKHLQMTCCFGIESMSHSSANPVFSSLVFPSSW